jgi:hypothetical protein
MLESFASREGGSVWAGRLSNKAGRVRLKSHIA